MKALLKLLVAKPAAASKSPILDVLQKAGARHGLRDRTHLTTAHDALSALVDAAHCGAAGMAKANTRHSKADMARIEKCHGLLIELGAACPGMEKKA